MDQNEPPTPVPPKGFRRERAVVWALLTAAAVVLAAVVIFGNGAPIGVRALAALCAVGAAVFAVWAKGGLFDDP